MSDRTASFTLEGKTFDLPVRQGTVGPDVVDIGPLYKNSQMFTYDPGFTSTASCESKITYIDGDEGTLLYRGYPIDQLAEHGDFLETCYLLLYGELPTATQKSDFDYRVTRHTMIHEQMTKFFTGFRRDAHPMAVMVGCVGAMSAFYHDSTDITDPHQRMVASIRLIAKVPTLAAMAYKYHIGQPFMYPKNDLDFASNFLHMCFGVPCEDYKVNPFWLARWTASSSSTRIMSRTPRPRPCVSPVLQAQIHLHVSLPALPVSGALPMAAQTKRHSTCWRKLALLTAFQNSSPAQKTRTIRSA